MSRSGVLLRSEDIELVCEPFDGLLEFLVLGFTAFECTCGFLCRVKTGLESGVGRLQGFKLVLPLQ